MAKCAACGAVMEYIRTTLGKAMPVDPEYLTIRRDSKGKTMIVTDAGDVVRGSIDEAGDVKGRVSHFATCSAPERFRRPR